MMLPLLFSLLALAASPQLASAVSTLVAGDLAVVGFTSVNPDNVRILALVDLDAGLQFQMTDNGWFAGGGFRTNEGVLTYTVPSGGLTAGSVISFEDDISGAWAGSGSFLLASGDSIILFTGATATPNMVFGQQGKAAWDGDATSSTTSALPAGLGVGTSVATGAQANARYTGAKSGTRAGLLALITDPANWAAASSVADLSTVSSGFTVTGSGTPAPTSPTPPTPTPAPVVAPATSPIRAVRANPTTIGAVTVEGVVTVDLRSTGRRGFFLQMTTAAAAADALSGSEALFVFCGASCSGPGTVAFSEGSVLRVQGTGAEFAGSPQVVVTGLTSASATVVSSAQTFVVDAASGLSFAAEVNIPVLTLPVANKDTVYAATADMLVSFTHTMTVTNTFELKFGTLGVSQGGRLYAATMQVDAGAAVAAVEDLDERRYLKLDDGDSLSCPVPQVWPVETATPVRNGYIIPAAALRAAAVLRFEFDAWTLVPSVRGRGRIVGGWDTSASARVTDISPFVPSNANGRVRIVSLNVENYFTELGCSACRGADNAAEFERQKTKIFRSIAELDAAIFGLQEVQNDGGATLAGLVSDLNAFLGAPGKYSYVATGAVGNDAITCAIIYQSALVTPVGNFATLTYTSPADKSRPSVAQTFVLPASTDLFTVVVQHFKSKGSACDEDAPTVDFREGEGSCGFTRLTHANQLLAWLATTNPTGQTTTKYALLGDFNSHTKDRAVKAFTDAGYVDLAARDIAQPHSYSFDGRSSTLDYFLASPSLAASCEDTYEWHINSDESLLIDYNDEQFSFPTACTTKPPNYFDASTPFRGSDHDPLVAVCTFVVTTTPAPTPSVAVTPAPVAGSGSTQAPVAAQTDDGAFPVGVAAGVGGGIVFLLLAAAAYMTLARRSPTNLERQENKRGAPYGYGGKGVVVPPPGMTSSY